MNFSLALEAIKDGEKLTREGWNASGQFVFLVPGSTFTISRAPLLDIYPEGTVINYDPHIDLRNAAGHIVPWLASQGDVLANDWEMLD